MCKDIEKSDSSHWLAWASATVATGAGLTAGIKYANEKLQKGRLHDRYTIPAGRLENDSNFAIAMRKVVAACVQYPEGATRNDIWGTLRNEANTKSLNSVLTAKKLLGYTASAIAEARDTKILLPDGNAGKSGALFLHPDFAELVVHEPHLVPKFVAQCAIYASLDNPDSAESRNAVVATIGLLSGSESSDTV